MVTRTRFLLAIVAAVVLIGGCSDGSDPGTPNSGDQSLSGVIRGEIPGGLVDFEFAAKVGAGGDDPRLGSVLVRGRNLAYDADAGALTVDLSVVNDGGMEYPEPVGLTFVTFIPEGITIMDSDNDEDGAGALVMFSFEDDDGVWSPDEESEMRHVRFVVAAGTSIGFVARVDVGMTPPGGAIGGIVWHDEDEDGEIGDEEMGVGGVNIDLHMGEDTAEKAMESTMTADDGTYRFDGLDAGYYTVVRGDRDGMVGTTPAEMAVILVEDDGTVVDFLVANFGVARGEDPGDDFVMVGDYVRVKGKYDAELNSLMAKKFNVCRCDVSDDKHRDRNDCDCDDCDGDCDGDCDCDDCDDCDDCNDCDDCDGGCRENACWGRLAGPVTGFDLDERYLEIMGTKVYFTDKSDWEDHCDKKFRARVDATMDEDGEVQGCRKPHWWKGKDDRIRGFVQEVVRGDDDMITGVVILNTLVELPRDDDGDKPRD